MIYLCFLSNNNGPNKEVNHCRHLVYFCVFKMNERHIAVWQEEAYFRSLEKKVSL